MSQKPSNEEKFQPPPPLNLSNIGGGGFQPPPPLNFAGGGGFQRPPPLNLRIQTHSRSSQNFNAFLEAQLLSIEEGTGQEYGFTTSPRLTDEQREEWDNERNKNEAQARDALENEIDLNTNKKITFAEEKPKIHTYTPESSGGGGRPEGGGGAANN
jgi:hypothetical protein